MKLIIGLGNPGRIYAQNRHNIGFRCISHLAKLYSIETNRRLCHSQVGSGKIDEIKVVLAKPVTFVNLSGEAVGRLMRKYKIRVNDLIVICDDLDLPLGKLRLRPGGSAGGHKGIKSIISALGSDYFPRIKVGIGRPMKEDGTVVTDEDSIVDYVLSDFTPEEESVIKPAIAQVAKAILSILTDGVTAAMNKFN
ncbi:MAG: aminoacyl-tRNA hydrolase [Dehalococcoidia bacterium]|nr:aminoacyl-tRNA hydrolase [Dehalococcoidia bacterium]